jgi:glycosyltransferase involved in cell wall biosynthesis
MSCLCQQQGTVNNNKIAFITTHFPPSIGFGGVCESGFGLSSALARAGGRVEVITSDAALNGRISDAEFIRVEQNNLKVHPFRHVFANRLCFSLNAKRVIRDVLTNSDIAYINGIYTYPVTIGARIARQLKKPYVVAIRGGLEPWSYQQKYWKKRAFFVAILRPLLDNASCIHVTSRDEMNSCMALGLKGPFAIIPNGINPDDFGNLPASAAAEQTWPCLKGKSVVLFLSRLSKEKGLDMLLRIWPNISHRYPEAMLVIAGPDDRGYEKIVRKMIRDGQLSQNTLLAGSVIGRQKLMLYSRSDVFVLPSYSENFGNVVAEALACGIPVITTKGTPWEDIEKYDCGRWVPVNEGAIEDALILLLNMTSTVRKAMGKRGRDLINNRYTWDISAGKMIAVYKCILEGKNIPLYPQPSETENVAGVQNKSVPVDA